MAVSTLRLTVEEKNYWKFCMLNVRVVPDALRNYFDGLIPPTSLATTLNIYSSTILNLVTRKVINATQLNILQRIPGTIWPARISPLPIGFTSMYIHVTWCYISCFPSVVTKSSIIDELLRKRKIGAFTGCFICYLRWFQTPRILECNWLV